MRNCFQLSFAALLLVSGCPAASDNCRAAGACPPGEACSSDAECAEGLCDFLEPGTSTERECLQACGVASCPAGYVCRVLGAGGYCRVDDTTIDGGGADAGRAPDGGDPADSGEMPDARIGGACPSAGEMRVVACGNCGMQSQGCSDALVWEDVGACLGQGECAAGANETMATEMCGEQQRLCGDDCVWLAWEFTVPEGECRPDTCDCGAGLPNRWRCSADCVRVPDPTCDDTVPCEKAP